MKKCPKCKAEIQEGARFCLYCMTSFEEKQTVKATKENNKRLIYVVIAILCVLLIAVGAFILVPKDKKENNSESSSRGVSASGEAESAEDGADDISGLSGSLQQSGEASSQSGESQAQSSSNNQTGSTATNTTTGKPAVNSGTQNNTTNGTTANNTNSNGSSSAVTVTPTPDTSTSVKEDSSNVQSSKPSSTEPKYTYIEATCENAYPTGYSVMYAPEDAIVITKVNYKEADGNYVIPEKIDGKKVAAVMPSAFSDSAISSTVKSVTLPATVRTIWGDAFKNCVNLKDLYLKSTVIAIYTDAFPATSKRNEKLTIHCKNDCRDFDFYYYRNIADKYDAKYELWNG